GPRGDAAYDWAGWASLYFGDRPPVQKSPFQPVYDREVKISEYDDVLPRVSIYRHAALAKTDAEVLRRLAEPAFDIFESVVLQQTDLNEAELQIVERLNREAPE